MIGFRPREVSSVYRTLVLAGRLDMARWLMDRVGVLRSAATHASCELMAGLAERGDVATLEWVVAALNLGAEHGVDRVLQAAVAAGHVPVLEWAATRFALPPDRLGLDGVVRVAAKAGHADVVEWAAGRHQLSPDVLATRAAQHDRGAQARGGRRPDVAPYV